MLVECPSCGCRFKTKTSPGRQKVDISLNKIIETLRGESSVKQAAIKLKCSQGTIVNRLKYAGIEPKSLTGRKFTKGVKNENGN